MSSPIIHEKLRSEKRGPPFFHVFWRIHLENFQPKLLLIWEWHMDQVRFIRRLGLHSMLLVSRLSEFLSFLKNWAGLLLIFSHNSPIIRFWTQIWSLQKARKSARSYERTSPSSWGRQMLVFRWLLFRTQEWKTFLEAGWAVAVTCVGRFKA